MSIIRFIKSNWLYGKASSKMKKGQYIDAIEVLKAVLEIRKSDEVTNAIPMFDLGYCYYKCDNEDEALDWFSKSYEIYRKNKERLHSEPLYQLLIHYSYLLNKKGNNDLADRISAEAKGLKSGVSS